MGLKPPSVSLEGWVPTMDCQTHRTGDAGLKHRGLLVSHTMPSKSPGMDRGSSHTVKM